jgi:YidC/Oxa1 family membrane protein insertase
MEKRMILAVALSIAVLLGYQYFFSSPPLLPTAPSGKDNAASSAASGKPSEASRGAGGAPVAPAGGLAARSAAPQRAIVVSTPLYTATISTAGGGITSFLLNEYKDAPGPSGKPLDIVGAKDLQPPPLSLFLDENRPPLPTPPLFSSVAPGELSVKAGEDRSVLLTWESATGVRMTREYLFHGGRYDFEMRVQASNGSKEPVSVRPGVEL